MFIQLTLIGDHVFQWTQNVHAPTWKLKPAILGMYTVRPQKLNLINFTLQSVITFTKFFAFQKIWHLIPQKIHYLTPLTTLTQNMHRHTKKIQDTEGEKDLFSIPLNTGERPQSVLAWQCSEATTELLSTAQTQVCMHAYETIQRRITLWKGEGWLSFFNSLNQSLKKRPGPKNCCHIEVSQKLLPQWLTNEREERLEKKNLSTCGLTSWSYKAFHKIRRTLKLSSYSRSCSTLMYFPVQKLNCEIPFLTQYKSF